MAIELKHTPADIVAHLLIELGVASDVEAVPQQPWPVGVGAEADEPDNVITVYDTSPRMAGRYMNTADHIEYYGFMVRVRADDYAEGYSRASAVCVELDKVYRRDITIAPVEGGGPATTYQIQSISRTTNVVPAGTDANAGRRLFTVNGLLTLNPV